jgi:hypothetical protein
MITANERPLDGDFWISPFHGYPNSETVTKAPCNLPGVVVGALAPWEELAAEVGRVTIAPKFRSYR